MPGLVLCGRDFSTRRGNPVLRTLHPIVAARVSRLFTNSANAELASECAQTAALPAGKRSRHHAVCRQENTVTPSPFGTGFILRETFPGYWNQKLLTHYQHFANIVTGE